MIICKYCTEPTGKNEAGKAFFEEFEQSCGSLCLDYMSIAIMPDTGQPVIHYEDKDGNIMMDCGINFCPICGAQLNKNYVSIR